MKNIMIGGTPIALNTKPFVVAELSGNHKGSVSRVLQLVDAAASAGAHCVKLQSYRPEDMTLDIRNEDFLVLDPKSVWNQRSLYELYAEGETRREWHEAIFKRARSLGMEVFSSVFSVDAIDFLENLNVPAYKIASQECCDLALVRAAASTKKPLIISTGMATLSEINETVQVVKDAGNEKLILLKCTSNYPAAPSDSNLLTIKNMREIFNCEVGFSDHTMGIGASLAAIASGASVIEKHFTLCSHDGALDSTFSIDPEGLKMLVTESERAWQSLGCVHYGPTLNEKESLKYRRSLYAICDINKGENFTMKNVKAIRPGFGIPPKFLEILLKKSAKNKLSAGSPITWENIG